MIEVFIAGTVSGLCALTITSILIRVFLRAGVREVIRVDGPEAHLKKSGTPTMGGVAIVLSATIAYFVAHGAVALGLGGVSVSTGKLEKTGLTVLAVMWALALLGSIDDIKKIRKRSLGLSKKAKFVGQIVIGGVLAIWISGHVPGFEGPNVPRSISFAGTSIPGLANLPLVLFALWVTFLIASTSNAVNLTDGLDGLASGSAMLCMLVYVIISFWEARNPNFYFPFNELCGSDKLATITDFTKCATSGEQLDLAVVAIAILGSCAGFLWFNSHPAGIFMGDTGSLALGGAMATMAILTRTQLLLAVIGGLFVAEAGSVIIQVAVFKLFGGRRVFRMSPLHHHFELKDWEESKVIVRFWLIGAAMCALGLGIFYGFFQYQSIPRP